MSLCVKHRVLEASPRPVLVGCFGQIISVNPACERALFLSSSELCGTKRALIERTVVAWEQAAVRTITEARQNAMPTPGRSWVTLLPGAGKEQTFEVLVNPGPAWGRRPATVALIKQTMPREAVNAPIFVEGEPFGILSAQRDTLTPSETGAIELFAHRVGSALENVRHHRRAAE